MRSLPFDSQISGYDDEGYPIYDRAADSSQLAALFKEYFTNGIFTNPSTSFQVIPSDNNMSVVVKAGAGNINGYFCDEDTDRTLVVQASDTTYDRIDRVVLRLNLNVSVRSIDLYVLQGIGASSPTAPELTRNSSIYELCLAEIYIPKNTTSISVSRITDTRLDTNKCGVVQQTIQTIDTSSIFTQYQAALDEYLDIVASTLDETIAVNLQNQINSVNEDLTTKIDTVNADLTNSVNTINADLTNIWDKMYPVGSIYMSVKSTSPSVLFGGTWSLWGSGRVPVGINTSDSSFNTVEKAGGSKTHTHTLNAGYAKIAYNVNGDLIMLRNTPIASPKYEVNIQTQIGTGTVPTQSTNDGTVQLGGNTDSTTALPPYITCYMWKRTA